MPYQQLIGSNKPGFILILLDQSGSMSDPYPGGTKAEVAALAVNRVIYEIVLASTKGEEVKDRCYVGLIGYGAPHIRVLLNKKISEIAAQPLRIKKVNKSISDGAGGLVTVQEEMPIWVEPKYENGTPMAEAYEEACQAVQAWTSTYPDNFPPIIINITDGAPNDMARAEAAAQKLMQMGTSDGNALLLNAHISNANTGEIRLPNTMAGSNDKFAEFLFGISSVLPEPMLAAASAVGFNPPTGARGFVYNAGAETLIKLLNFGSSVAR